MKYPNKIKKNPNKNSNSLLSFKNRGDNLEYILNLANHYYLQNDIAVIHKKPTPIKVVDIQNGQRPIITKGFFQTPSTTDYNGIYRGSYIDFEAKETQSNTAFSLSNIHSHQIEHLVNVDKHGGIAFLIIMFTNLDQTYLLPLDKFQMFIKENTRKSIPISFFKEQAYLINYNFHPRIDYLAVVDKVYFN